MFIIYDSARRSKSARHFATGLSARRAPYTAADLAWAAQAFADDSPDYDLLAAESEAQASYDAGVLPL